MKRFSVYKKGDWKKIIWFSFAIFIILRILFLDADPPEHLNWAWGEWVDAGSYSYNARNKILFGKWELDDWNLMWVVPIPHIITYFIFKLLGVGFWQNNLVPAIFSSAMLFLFYFLLRSAYSSYYAYIGTILLGINYLMITYSRIGNRVTEMIFFLVLSAYFWQKGFSKIFYFYLAGIAAGLAFLSKPSMVNFFPALILSTLICSILGKRFNQWKEIIKPIIFLLLGLLTIGLFWYFFLFLPHQHIYDIFIGKDVKVRTPFSFIKLLRNIWKTPIAYYFSKYLPVLFYVSLLYILKIIYSFFQKGKAKPIEIFSVLWFASDFFFNTIINYRPLRFFVSSIPPLIIIFVSFFKYLWEIYQFKIEKLKASFLAAMFIWLFFTVQYLINENIYFLSEKVPIKAFSFYRLPFPQNYYQAYKTVFFLTLIIMLFAYFFAYFLKERIYVIRGKIGKAIALVLFCISFAFQINLYADWVINHKSYKIINYSRFLMEIIPKGPISGNIAPMFCFENELKAYLIYQDRNNWYNKPFQRYGITHMQMANPHDERDNYFYGFRDVMENSSVIATFPLRGRMEELWKKDSKIETPIIWKTYGKNNLWIKNKDKILPHYAKIKSSQDEFIVKLEPLEEKLINIEGVVSVRQSDYSKEFELCKREVGMPTYDPEANNLISVKPEKRSFSLVCLDNLYLNEGLYEILIRVKYEKKQDSNKKIEIRLYDEEGEPIDVLDMYFKDIPLNKYSFIYRKFKIQRDQNLIIEIFNPEAKDIYLDTFQIVPIDKL